ncbi:hypothetical protein [Actinomadura violacea]|uniref:Uncharacterized protein n=1 Tax=Actinomadura violacea TaxID=2819934 RepID=A0ABS3RXS1_9ACTN|nr:hypothetical protein [Actinomadura violacea]MBO2461554.1 hypothetical protein [Actinomadura violacea]
MRGWRRAPWRAELSGAIALASAVVLGLLYWRTGVGPYGGGAMVMALFGVMLAWPVREPGAHSKAPGTHRGAARGGLRR